MNPTSILALISDLYDQIASVTVERDALQAKNIELHAACAELQEEVTQLKAEPAKPARSTRKSR